MQLLQGIRQSRRWAEVRFLQWDRPVHLLQWLGQPRRADQNAQGSLSFLCKVGRIIPDHNRKATFGGRCRFIIMSGATDYSWLVERRSKIQGLLLALYEFVKHHRCALEGNCRDRELFGLLTGAAFSLWRAAFLTDIERAPALVLDGVEHFLQLVVRDNAINFPQDRQTRAWTVGYYLNNARFRVLRFLEKVRDDKTFSELDHKSEVERFAALHDEGQHRTDAHAAWDATYDVICLAFEELASSLDRAST
jgi:hypothetical protein